MFDGSYVKMAPVEESKCFTMNGGNLSALNCSNLLENLGVHF